MHLDELIDVLFKETLRDFEDIQQAHGHLFPPHDDVHNGIPIAGKIAAHDDRSVRQLLMQDKTAVDPSPAQENIGQMRKSQITSQQFTSRMLSDGSRESVERHVQPDGRSLIKTIRCPPSSDVQSECQVIEEFFDPAGHLISSSQHSMPNERRTNTF